MDAEDKGTGIYLVAHRNTATAPLTAIVIFGLILTIAIFTLAAAFHSARRNHEPLAGSAESVVVTVSAPHFSESDE